LPASLAGGGFKKENMPVPVTKYRCQFKCGMKAKHSVKEAEKHEATCYRNPANKTCVTCINEKYEREGAYCSRGCKLKIMNDFMYEIDGKLTVTNAVIQHVRPLFNCPNWNKDEHQPMTIAYLAEIRPKIEEAYERRLKAEKESRELPF
jgi:hypothetical protein